MASSSGTGSGSRYLDPNRVFELVTRRKPRELLDYLDLIPGHATDTYMNGVLSRCNMYLALIVVM
jgi:hypothetical protein